MNMEQEQIFAMERRKKLLFIFFPNFGKENFNNNFGKTSHSIEHCLSLTRQRVSSKYKTSFGIWRENILHSPRSAWSLSLQHPPFIFHSTSLRVTQCEAEGENSKHFQATKWIEMSSEARNWNFHFVSWEKINSSHFVVWKWKCCDNFFF